MSPRDELRELTDLSQEDRIVDHVRSELEQGNPVSCESVARDLGLLPEKVVGDWAKSMIELRRRLGNRIG